MAHFQPRSTWTLPPAREKSRILCFRELGMYMQYYEVYKGWFISEVASANRSPRIQLRKCVQSRPPPPQPKSAGRISSTPIAEYPWDPPKEMSHAPKPDVQPHLPFLLSPSDLHAVPMTPKTRGGQPTLALLTVPM